MVTVIIPTLNEQETIAAVVQSAFSCNKVTEVLVIDDKSVDDTVRLAKAAGAKEKVYCLPKMIFWFLLMVIFIPTRKT